MLHRWKAVNQGFPTIYVSPRCAQRLKMRRYYLVIPDKKNCSTAMQCHDVQFKNKMGRAKASSKLIVRECCWATASMFWSVQSRSSDTRRSWNNRRASCTHTRTSPSIERLQRFDCLVYTPTPSCQLTGTVNVMCLLACCEPFLRLQVEHHHSFCKGARGSLQI